MNEQISLLLVGGAIGLLSSLIGAVVQYRLALRRFEKELERKLSEERQQAIRESLLKNEDAEEVLKAINSLKHGTKQFNSLMRWSSVSMQEIEQFTRSLHELAEGQRSVVNQVRELVDEHNRVVKAINKRIRELDRLISKLRKAE
jgi:methyl-accepting chemotaxis protein